MMYTKSNLLVSKEKEHYFITESQLFCSAPVCYCRKLKAAFLVR